MNRSQWCGALGAVVASAGLAWGQWAPSKAAPSSTDKIVGLREMDGPEQKARLLQTWTLPSGQKATHLQLLETGEMLTVVESGPGPGSGAGGSGKTVGAQIYHWGNQTTPPTGTPVPPGWAPPKAVPIVPKSADKLPLPQIIQGVEAASALAPASASGLVEPPPLPPPPAPSPVVQTTTACAPCLAVPGAKCCPAYVYRYEKVPHIYFKKGNCLPVVPPYCAPEYGYYATQWRAWPGAAPLALPTLPAVDPVPTTPDNPKMPPVSPTARR